MQAPDSPAPDDAASGKPDALLDIPEARVLGSLMEKELATPEHYPLTLSSLAAACNQKSNRDPVMSMDTEVVEKVLIRLRRDKKLATMFQEAGARVPKFRHEMRGKFGLQPVECAVLAELMLRGPQTLAELKTRVTRMVSAAGLEEVEAALSALENVQGQTLVRKLPRAHGRRESRYAHQLCGEVLAESGEHAPVVIEAPPSPDSSRMDALEAEVRALREEIGALREAFETFKTSFE